MEEAGLPRRTAHGGASRRPLLWCCLAALAIAACDETFEPLAPGAPPLSVWGYLDAAADTQWIRVTTIRARSVTSPGPSDAMVTLEHVGTGQLIELRDSLFPLSDPGGLGVVYVHNFWTTERIEPGATYRFSARREGEEPAEAVVGIPRDYAVEVWVSQLPAVPDSLRISPLSHLPFLVVTAHFRDACGSDALSRRAGGHSSDDEVLMIRIDTVEIRSRDAPPECGDPTIARHELWLVGSAAPWPEGPEFEVGALGGVPELASNVTNALGFLGGVLTRTVPYEKCVFQGREEGMTVPNHCRLRYDRETATLTGTVIETRCEDGPIAAIPVELRELDGEPPTHRKVRPTRTSPVGGFRIGGLEPGMRYFLRARDEPEIDADGDEVYLYSEGTDTLELEPGEERQVAVELERLTDCDESPEGASRD